MILIQALISAGCLIGLVAIVTLYIQGNELEKQLKQLQNEPNKNTISSDAR
jgi:hypothetical protein